ncbi:MAG: integrin [Sandaracinaceae bacterium]|nr:integrin [Sandaracinaceae bacterium]
MNVSLMRFTLVLLPSLLLGCGSSPQTAIGDGGADLSLDAFRADASSTDAFASDALSDAAEVDGSSACTSSADCERINEVCQDSDHTCACAAGYELAGSACVPEAGLIQQEYLKASNTGADDGFGVAAAVSADGNTIAVSAVGESSNARGVGGDETDDSSDSSGAVYVFARDGVTWRQQAYIKTSNSEAGDGFGAIGAVALSGDGSTLVVGAISEDSAASGVGGDQTSNSATSAGAVYVFTRTADSWSQQAYIKASNPDSQDLFGRRVAVSADGDTVAVGTEYESSNATGVGGIQSDNTSLGAGAVYVFARVGTAWSQEAYVKASNTDANDGFGTSVSLSGDGNLLAVGAPGEDGAGTGLGGTDSDDSFTGAGAAYLFERVAHSWTQTAYVKASNTSSVDAFGSSIAIASDGHTLVVGAQTEDGASQGINGNQSVRGAFYSGAAYIFAQSGSTWVQQAYVKASNAEGMDLFGKAVSISADGSTVLVSTSREGSSAVGINGDESDNSAVQSGAVYLLQRVGSAWTQEAYLKASNSEAGDQFAAIGISGDAHTIVVGAVSEDSAATGVAGDQTSNAQTDSGAAYVFAR